MIQTFRGCQSGAPQIQVRKAEGILGLFQAFSSLMMGCSAKAAANGIDSAIAKTIALLYMHVGNRASWRHGAVVRLGDCVAVYIPVILSEFYEQPSKAAKIKYRIH